MRAFYYTFFVWLLLILTQGVSFAEIESSAHDMTAQEFFARDEVTERSNCSYCHFVFKDKGHKIWGKTPKSLKGFGKIAPFCFSCHDGVTIVDINVDASRTAFSPKSHGLFITNLPSGDSISNVPLKHTDGKTLECTTCHNPHNTDNRPFLAVPISELCGMCHQSRRNSGYGDENAESNHPVATDPSDSTGGPSPINLNEIYQTAFPEPYPIEGGKFAEGVHWDLGGHLSAGKYGNIECYTCHSVHGDEFDGPNEKLMTVNPVRGVSDEFCEGCHQGERGDKGNAKTTFPNPGGTKEPRTYHPADDDISNGEGRIVKITEPEGWPFGTGDEKNILCSTCHDIHNGLPNSPILRTPKGDTFCEECHDKELVGHHSSGKDSNPKNLTFKTTGMSWTYETLGLWENGNPKLKFEASNKSNGYGKTYGKNVQNKIYCSSCHRAHNAGMGITKAAVPLLVVSHTANQLCFLCHYKQNPTFSTNLVMTATHFMGDSSSPETYNKPSDKVSMKRDEWLETGLVSKYGGANEKEVVCESCHVINKNNLNNTKYEYLANNEKLLIARSDENLEWIVQNPGYRKENADPEGAVPAGYYLCVGCHGEDPGNEGAVIVSHRMMNIDGKMPDGSLINRKVVVPPVTYTKNFNLNCESCHSVHNSKVAGGSFLMKEVDGENTDPLAIQPTPRDYTNFCTHCHMEQGGAPK